MTSNLQPQWPRCLSSLVSWNKLQTGDDHNFFPSFTFFFRLDRCELKSHLFGRGCLNLAVPAEKREMKNDLCVYPFEILNKSPMACGSWILFKSNHLKDQVLSLQKYMPELYLLQYIMFE